MKILFNLNINNYKKIQKYVENSATEKQKKWLAAVLVLLPTLSAA